MSVPDNELIAEVMLFAEGFGSAKAGRSLSKESWCKGNRKPPMVSWSDVSPFCGFGFVAGRPPF